jgi:uncharacterized protein
VKSGNALNSLEESLRPFKRIGVAFSGGVDSATLLAASARILGGENVIAFIGVSASLARRELLGAQNFASALGVKLVEISTDEFNNPDYLANRGDRCFFCKDSLFRAIADFDFTHYHLDAIAYGENADDSLRKDRPGQRAASQWGAIKPLSEAGLTKEDVRLLARELNLSVADKPASPCLSSRIKPFIEVTPGVLAQIEIVEDFLIALGFSDMRARYLGTAIRIEVPEENLTLLHSVEVQNVLKVFEIENGLPSIESSHSPLSSGSFSASTLESIHV